MRGVGFEVEEMMKLFLVIIIGLGVVILIIAASGGISALLTEFCAKNPSICGGNLPNSNQAASAEASTNALVKAINCVSNPSTCDCNPVCTINIDDYKTSSTNDGLTGKMTGFETAINNANSKTIEINCDKKTNSCGVKNFYLPENFAGFNSPSEYIAGFGDPSFLVYWQSFPQGEDAAWQSFSTWYEGVGTIMFLSMCATDILSPALKGASWVIKGGKIAKLSDAYAYSKTETEGIMNWLAGVLDKTSKQTSTLIKKETRISDNRIRITFEEGRSGTISALYSVLKDESAEWFKSNWKPAMAQAMTYAGIDSVGAYAASRIDSEIGKVVNEYPNNIILGKPLNKAKIYPLTNLEFSPPKVATKVAMPIILDKSGTLANDASPFYLASPCHTDLKVYNPYVLCNGYYYDFTTKKTGCSVVYVSDSLPADGFLCGQISLLNIDGSHKIFSDNNNDGKWDEITFYNKWSPDIPTSGVLGSYLNNIDIKDTDFNGKFDQFTENFNDGKTVITKDSNNDGQFDLIDTNNDGKFEIQLKDFFEGNTKAKAYSDEDKDGQYENYLGDTGYFRIISYNVNTNYDEIPGTQFSKFTIMDSVPFMYIIRNTNGNIEAFSVPTVIFLDVNNDGNFEFVQPSIASGTTNLANGFWQCKEMDGGTCTKGSHITKSENGNGYKIETIGQCYIKSISVKLENQNNYKEDHNFCYKQKSEWKTIAVTSSQFALDAFAKRFTGPIGWALGTAADCGLAYYDIKSDKPWPDN